MSQPFAEALSGVPKSRGLAMTLARAFEYAKAQSHRMVSLEHLLLALITDAEASVVLQACQVDLNHLNAGVSSYLAQADEQLAPDESADPVASPDLLRILEYAAAAAKQSRRREVNGAIVLAAIVGDGRSPAAGILRDQGLTFEEAIKALQKANVSTRSADQAQPQQAPEPSPPAAASPEPAAAPAPEAGPAYAQPPAERGAEPREHHGGRAAPGNGATGQSTEDILAAARRRVGSGLNGRRPSPAPPPNPHEWAPPPEHGEPQHQAADHYPIDESTHPAPPHDGPSDGSYGADDPDDGLQAPPREEAQPDRAFRPPHPEPLHRPERGPASRSDRGGATPQPPPSVPPDDTHDRWPPPHRQPEPYGPPPGPTLDWPPYPPMDDRYPPQAPRRPDASRPPPAPPRRPPPPRHPPEQARSGQPPWSEPPPPPFSQGPPQGARRPASARSASARTASESRRMSAAADDRPPTTQVSAGQLVENIPRTMTVGVPELVEVSIARAEVAALAERLQGSGTAYRHELVVTKAMSVRLRAPEGGFWIETASPETQWIENTLGLLSDDFASWRWTVTPQRRGRARLQLIVSARTVGADGLAAETALPDQVIEVKVRTNYRRTAIQWGGWIAAALIGGILAKFGEGLWFIGSAVLMQLGLI